MFSLRVHDWIYSGEHDDLIGIIVVGICALGPLAVLIAGQTVPGFPGLHAYLTG